ncbi:hypothetical protein L1987_27241 [Smallanthus sonchifolius]|uniref:Uncharacterized protein n=1 Tax=Smallanthus sonchifolius TaxID=185202 RepID=A0ACB9IBE5_9ASTR|nr:hypothetical protein L1987_27241 [Smallanthus sonchifolius]
MSFHLEFVVLSSKSGGEGVHFCACELLCKTDDVYYILFYSLRPIWSSEPNARLLCFKDLYFDALKLYYTQGRASDEEKSRRNYGPNFNTPPTRLTTGILKPLRLRGQEWKHLRELRERIVWHSEGFLLGFPALLVSTYLWKRWVLDIKVSRLSKVTSRSNRCFGTPCCQSVLAVMLAKAGLSVGFTYYWI